MDCPWPVAIYVRWQIERNNLKIKNKKCGYVNRATDVSLLMQLTNDTIRNASFAPNYYLIIAKFVFQTTIELLLYYFHTTSIRFRLSNTSQLSCIADRVGK